MAVVTRRGIPRSAKRPFRGKGLSVAKSGNGYSETLAAIVETDADFRLFKETGTHLLPEYKTLDSLFASWK